MNDLNDEFMYNTNVTFHLTVSISANYIISSRVLTYYADTYTADNPIIYLLYPEVLNMVNR